MEHKKNKSSLKEISSAIQGFYFLVKFGLAFIYILKSYRKKYSSIFLRKNMFNSLLAFFFWKVCIFSSFERFSSPIFSLLSFICLPKWIRSERYFLFFLQDIGSWERNNQNHFHSVEIGSDVLIYINKKQVFQIEIDYTTARETLKSLNTTIVVRTESHKKLDTTPK